MLTPVGREGLKSNKNKDRGMNKSSRDKLKNQADIYIGEMWRKRVDLLVWRWSQEPVHRSRLLPPDQCPHAETCTADGER